MRVQYLPKLGAVLSTAFILSACVPTNNLKDTPRIPVIEFHGGSIPHLQDAEYNEEHKNTVLGEQIEQYRKLYKQAGYKFSNGTDESNKDAIRSFTSRLHHAHDYKKDQPNDESWDSMTHAFLTGGIPSGDCDDLGTTGAELAILAGVPEHRVLRLIGTTEKWILGSMYGGPHMMSGYVDDNGEIWIFGDTFSPRLRKLSEAPEHTMTKYSRYSWNSQWKPLTTERPPLDTQLKIWTASPGR